MSSIPPKDSADGSERVLEVWFDRKRTRAYAIRQGSALPAGGQVIRSLSGRELRVDSVAIAVYEITGAEAKALVSDQLEEGYSSFRGALDQLLGRTGSVPSELEDALGISPVDVIMQPEEAIARLQEALERATSATPRPPTDDERAEMKQRFAVLAQQIRSASTSPVMQDLGQRLRSVLTEPKTADAMEDLGVRLEAWGKRLAGDSRGEPPEGETGGETPSGV